MPETQERNLSVNQYVAIDAGKWPRAKRGFRLCVRCNLHASTLLHPASITRLGSHALRVATELRKTVYSRPTLYSVPSLSSVNTYK